MRIPWKSLRQIVDVAILVTVFPLAGVMLAGKDPGRYLEFPPDAIHVEHAPFSWWVFTFMAAGILAAVLPFIVRVMRRRGERSPALAEGKFPRWGWAGVAFGLGTWVLAWTRFDWFIPLQRYTFTPLWMAFILVVNAWTQKRSGHCMLRDRPVYTALLFLFSAAFWWCFEYLNRFVQNWYYVGVEDLSPAIYILQATLPFSTVLPAVLGTADLLATMPALSCGLEDFWKLRLPRPRAWAVAGGIAAAAGLLAVGVWPSLLFPLLWVAPLVLLTSLRAWRGQPTVFTPLRDGDWRRVCLLALAALVCGFFWELWNWSSLAKWIYRVPYVQRFHIFEMPLLGYAGYLPFGLECAVIADSLAAESASPGATSSAGALPSRGVRLCRGINLAVAIGLALFFFILPGILVTRHLADPAISKGEVPQLAWSLHRNLTPRYGTYARNRVTSGQAGDLNLYDVPSTEWPIFGSVYYLWATENLQAAWEADANRTDPAPAVYARDTIEACVDLVLDPVHHTWVQTHWGTNYMHRENVFFRALIIAAITAEANLLQEDRHLELLRDQVNTLAADLDASPHGVLNDYPDECYPIDVLCAIACIQRADAVLGTDHSAFVARAVRGFEGHMADDKGLIPYLVDPITAQHYGPSRGVGNSYILIFARELWPEKAKIWTDQYVSHFWQDRGWATGFREFPPELSDGEWGYDVDAGPILAGFSPAANAFGLPAMVINGRLDLAATLWNQVLPACWPLPNGHLLGPKILSDWEHAPYLGEACMLYFMSARPAADATTFTGGQRPGLVWISLAFFFGIGALIIGSALWNWWRHRDRGLYCPGLQLPVWILLLAGAAMSFAVGHVVVSVICLLAAQCVPRSGPAR